MGDYMGHSNNLLLVLDYFSFDRHGLTRDDVNRRDRQNWRYAQRLVFTRVQECLQEIVDGNGESPPNDLVMGTLVFTKIIWFYVEIFVSPIASLSQHIKYAAMVTHFLTIWRNFVGRSRNLTLHRNFLSRETYTDVLMSSHFAVMVICYMRDNFADIECRLDLIGTDLVESYWSANGQWVGNRHNYYFGRLSQNASHIIRLNQIRVDPQAPNFARLHPKGEVIWPSHFGDYQRADLTRYPLPGEEINAWREGSDTARQLARDAGMMPLPHPDQSSDDDNDGWFYRPFAHDCNPLHNFQGDDHDYVDDNEDNDPDGDQVNWMMTTLVTWMMTTQVTRMMIF